MNSDDDENWIAGGDDRVPEIIYPLISRTISQKDSGPTSSDDEDWQKSKEEDSLHSSICQRDRSWRVRSNHFVPMPWGGSDQHPGMIGVIFDLIVKVVVEMVVQVIVLYVVGGVSRGQEVRYVGSQRQIDA